MVASRTNLFQGHTSLTIVAAVDAIAQERAQFLGDRPVVLDREVGDAAPGVEEVRGDDGARGADGEAFLAGAAMPGRGRVALEVEGHEELAEEEIRTGRAREQQGVLALPAQARAGGEGDFHHRRAVGEHAVGEGAELARHAIGERLELAAQDLVVIATQRVARNEGALAIGEDGLGVEGAGGPVVQAHAHHGERPGHQLRGAGPASAVACHIIHGAVPAAPEPVEQRGFFRVQARARDRDRVEAQLAAPLPDAILDASPRLCPHRSDSKP